MSRLLLVVAYDIADDRRREAVSAALAGVGVRVQYSVFEVEIDASPAADGLLRRLAGLIDDDEDQVRVYQLPAEPGTSQILGRRRLEERADFWII